MYPLLCFILSFLWLQFYGAWDLSALFRSFLSVPFLNSPAALFGPTQGQACLVKWECWNIKSHGSHPCHCPPPYPMNSFSFHIVLSFNPLTLINKQCKGSVSHCNSLLTWDKVMFGACPAPCLSSWSIRLPSYLLFHVFLIHQAT